MIRLPKFLFVLCLVLLEPTGPSAAQMTYYTSTTGNDAQAGDFTRPFLTIAHGKSVLGPGDTLFIRGGTYAEAITSAPSGTSWATRVRIAAYPGETVRMAPSTDYVINLTSERYIEFDGIDIDGSGTVYGPVALIGSSHHVRIQNAEIIGSPTAGNCANICGAEASEFIRLVIHGGGIGGGCGTPCGNAGIYTGGSNNLIDGCEIYDVSMEGIQIYNGTASNNIIRNNRVHDVIRSGDANPGARIAGILIASGSNNLVYNNLVYNNGRSDGSSENAGITVYGGGTSGTKIWHNTVYGNHHYGIVIQSGAPDTVVRNNIIYGNSAGTLLDGGTRTVSDHNLQGTNPLFVDAGAGDFRLRSGSLAIDNGITVSQVIQDFDGVTRPNGSGYDIGAYEFNSGVLIGPPHAPTSVHVAAALVN